MRYLRNGVLAEDAYELVTDDAAALPAAAIVPLPRWQVEAAAGRVHGLLVRPDDARADAVAAALRAPLVAIEFASFNDGRGYSIARQFREAGYTGDLRALGDVLRDQAFFLLRCGFTTLVPAAHVDVAEFVRGLADFTTPYQPAADGRPTVLALRRRG